MERDRVNGIVDNVLAGLILAGILGVMAWVYALVTAGEVVTPWVPWLAGLGALTSLFGLGWLYFRLRQARAQLVARAAQADAAIQVRVSLHREHLDRPNVITGIARS